MIKFFMYLSFFFFRKKEIDKLVMKMIAELEEESDGSEEDEQNGKGSSDQESEEEVRFYPKRLPLHFYSSFKHCGIHKISTSCFCLKKKKIPNFMINLQYQNLPECIDAD